MTGTETANTTENGFDLDRFYDAAMAITGNPPEDALFDSQLAAGLSTEWLVERAQIEEGLERAELELMLAKGLNRTYVISA